MNTKFFAATVLTATVLVSGQAASAQHPRMPAGMTHEEHLAQMKKDAEMRTRGAEAMGFDQETTTHHFYVTAAGGVIDVGVNDPADTAGRDRIRIHLREIADEFAKGDFEKPFMTHGEMPPGVEVMTSRSASITYAFEPTANGGLVRISTRNATARRAVHEFLRYQIKAHATGDRITPPQTPRR